MNLKTLCLGVVASSTLFFQTQILAEEPDYPMTELSPRIYQEIDGEWQLVGYANENHMLSLDPSQPLAGTGDWWLTDPLPLTLFNFGSANEYDFDPARTIYQKQGDQWVEIGGVSTVRNTSYDTSEVENAQDGIHEVYKRVAPGEDDFHGHLIDSGYTYDRYINGYIRREGQEHENIAGMETSPYQLSDFPGLEDVETRGNSFYPFRFVIDNSNEGVVVIHEYDYGAYLTGIAYGIILNE